MIAPSDRLKLQPTLFEPLTLKLRFGKNAFCCCATVASLSCVAFSACFTETFCFKAIATASSYVMRCGPPPWAPATLAAASVPAVRQNMSFMFTPSSMTARRPRGARLLVPQRLNWIERGRFPRRVVPEEHTDRRRESHGDCHGGYRRRRCPPGEVAEQRRTGVADEEPDHTTQHAHRHALDEELRQHVRAARADCHADPDLARPLGHRHEHDVHDADAADDQ